MTARARRAGPSGLPSDEGTRAIDDLARDGRPRLPAHGFLPQPLSDGARVNVQTCKCREFRSGSGITRLTNRVVLCRTGAAVWYKDLMALSARNQLPGIVEDVKLGTVMALIAVRVGDNLVESVITRASAEDLGLKKGDAVRAVIKSTAVMIQKD